MGFLPKLFALGLHGTSSYNQERHLAAWGLSPRVFTGQGLFKKREDSSHPLHSVQAVADVLALDDKELEI